MPNENVYEIKGIAFSDFEPEHVFALRDFNSSCILQRKFFSDFNFDKNMTDKEILSAFKFEITFEINAADLELNSEKLLDLSFVLDAYLKHINRHCERLKRYTYEVASVIADGNIVNVEDMRLRYKRGQKLIIAYSSACRFIQWLKKDTDETLKEFDSKTKHWYRKIFSDRLKFARQSTGLTQKKFAQKIGMSQNGFSQFETGQREPSIPMLIRLSKILGRSADWLLGQTAL